MSKQDDTKKSPRKSRSAAKKTLRILLHAFKWTFIFLFIFCFLAGGALTGYVTSLVKDDPVRTKAEIMQKINENELTGYVYFSDGTQVGQLRTDEDRQLVSINDVPDKLKNAFLATEDKDFYHHYGVDFNGFLRAIKEQVLHEDVQTGGSTITQQLARRVFLSLEQTYARKAKEIFLSFRLERLLTKDQIFEAYLNKIPFGNGSNGYNLYGIKAAAKGIFGVTDLNQLNIAQCAYLAGLPQSPSEYSTFKGSGKFNPTGFQAAKKRQELVLKRMLQENVISDQEYQDALAFDIKASLAPTEAKAYTTYPYLMIEAERKAAEILLMQLNPKITPADLEKPENADLLESASKQLRSGGYKVYTTIDKTIYDDMTTIAHNPDNFSPDSPKKGIQQVGAIMLDNKTGAVLGMMEGRDFYKEQLNHATQMHRDPGSTMKPIMAYVPALEEGKVSPATPIDDVPIILEDGSKGYHIPQNWDGKYHGLVSARVALNESYNIPALRLYNDAVGVKQAIDFAKSLGITSFDDQDYYAKTGVIGGLKYGTSVEEMANAYAAMGNHGIFNDAYMIQKIEDSEGNVVYEHKSEPKQVFSDQTAFLITDMMRTVITAGTATDLKSKFKYYGKVPIVGKTGSDNYDYNAWYMGYSPDITVGVWTGYDQPATLPPGKGTQGAKNIYAAIMNAAYEKEPQRFPTKAFAKPDGVVKITVSDVSGMLPSELTKESNHTATDWFNKAYIPTAEDNVLAKMQVIRYNKMNYIPQPGTPSDFVQDKLVIKRQTSIQSIIERLKDIFAKYPRVIPTNKYGTPRSIESFYPPGMEDDAPTQPDPRTDDGLSPGTPANAKVEVAGEKAKITFDPSPNEDVVGYRLYRSMNGAAFEKLDSVVYAGDDPQFVNYITPSFHYAYYVTAVDVAGRESAPTPLLYSDGMAGGMAPPPITGEGGGSGTGGTMIDPTGAGSSAVPGTPVNVRVFGLIGNTGVQIEWDKVPGANVQYRVYYSGKKAGRYQMIGTSDTNSFNYISVPAEGWYRVTAMNDSGESAPSAPVQFK